MAKYSVFVTGRLSKTFEIEADTKEDAMNTEGDVVSEVYTDADEIPSEEVKEENTTEE